MIRDQLYMRRSINLIIEIHVIMIDYIFQVLLDLG